MSRKVETVISSESTSWEKWILNFCNLQEMCWSAWSNFTIFFLNIRFLYINSIFCILLLKQTFFKTRHAKFFYSLYCQSIKNFTIFIVKTVSLSGIRKIKKILLHDQLVDFMYFVRCLSTALWIIYWQLLYLIIVLAESMNTANLKIYALPQFEKYLY